MFAKEKPLVGYLSTECEYREDDLPQILTLVEVDGLEEVGLCDSVAFARDQEVVYVLHLLERELWSIVLNFPGADDFVCEPANTITLLYNTIHCNYN